jgi:hypothetical protein
MPSGSCVARAVASADVTPCHFPAELHAPALEEFGRLGFRAEDELAMGQALGEFVNWTDWPELTRGLVSRGCSDEEIRGFLGLNWLNFMRRSGV